MTYSSPEHDRRYHELVAQYIDSFDDKLAALERAMRSAKQGDTGALAEAREIAHRMHGTAGCYGLRQLSEVAATLDDVLTRMKRGEGGTWDEADAAATPVFEIARAAKAARR